MIERGMKIVEIKKEAIERDILAQGRIVENEKKFSD
jgi:hypothetical protein